MRSLDMGEPMHASIFDGFFDDVSSRFSEWFAGFGDYWFLGKWWALGFFLLAGALVISWFFGALPVIGNWIRGAGGVLVLLYAAFLVGLTVAARHYQSQRKVNPPKPPTPTPPPPGGGSGFDWFRKG